jgi:acetyltransferase
MNDTATIAAPEHRGHDVLPRRLVSLDPLFEPHNVAVIGATARPGSVGRTVFSNLLNSTLGGAVYAVNPNHPTVLNVPTYPDIASIGQPVDLAMIVVRAELVPGMVRQCAEAGVKAVIILTAGFREVGGEGLHLEQDLLSEARKAGVRVLGPNCIGLMNVTRGLNASFAREMAKPGSVGFISQSGALMTAVLDWSLDANVGFSAFISAGNMVDIDWGDLIYHLGDDRHTKSIILYMQSVENARSFLSAAREVSYSKPVIVLKAGRTTPGAKAAARHSGSREQDDDVLDAVFQRCGVLRVHSIGDLFYMADALSKQPRPKGPRLAIVTNAGGPGVLAADALIEGGGVLADLSDAAMERLSEFLPPHWSRNNPIDLLGDACADTYGNVIDIVTKESESDGLLAILTPQAMTEPEPTAQKLVEFTKAYKKPVLASWMGASDVQSGIALLDRSNITTFHFPDTAARVFARMWAYSQQLQALYETPSLPADEGANAPDRKIAPAVIAAADAEDRVSLRPEEMAELITAYRLPVDMPAPIYAAGDIETATKSSPGPHALLWGLYEQSQILEANFAALGLTRAEEIVAAFDDFSARFPARAPGALIPSRSLLGHGLMVRSVVDPVFGPLIMLGKSGRVFAHTDDYAMALPPLNSTLALRLLERTRIYKELTCDGAGPKEIERLLLILVRFSYLLVEQPRVREIVLDPLILSPDGAACLHASIALYDAATPADQLATPAIRPYPHHYTATWITKQGLEVTIRPIRPEDEHLLAELHRSMSERSVYFRYFTMMGLEQRISHDRLVRTCFIDYDREMALVAIHRDPATGKEVMTATGRLTKLHDSPDAHFAVAVADAYHRQGLGSRLLRAILEIARDDGVRRVIGHILPENRGMQDMCKRIGFKVEYDLDEGVVIAVWDFDERGRDL